MEPLSKILWWCGDLMLILLLYRAISARLWKAYPYFYFYAAAVVCQAVVRLAAARNDAIYTIVYWASEFVTGTIGFGVTWEIYRDVLMPYEGIRRMARSVLLGLLVLVVFRGIVEFAANPRGYPSTTLEVVRNLGVGQAILLIAMLGLVVHYAVPMGRNLRWMLIGYGAYIGSNIVSRTLQAQSRNAEAFWWTFPTQVEYCITLMLWCVGLWSYHPNPAPDGALERDYERVSSQTARAIGRLRSHLMQSWRS
jgi:hypothetical protein